MRRTSPRRQKIVVSELVRDFTTLLGSDDLARSFEQKHGPLTTEREGDTAFLRERAFAVREALQLFSHLQQIDARDPEGIRGLRNWKRNRKLVLAPSVSREGAIARAQGAIAELLGVTEYVTRPSGAAASAFVREPRHASVLDRILATVSDWIVRRDPIAICRNSQCRVPFYKRDRRMKYCSRPCRAHGNYEDLASGSRAAARRRSGPEVGRKRQPT